jgi:hypothetical protein
MAASLKANLNYPIEEVIHDYLQCGKTNVHRIEHLIPVINYYHSIQEFDIAYIYSSHAMKYAGKLPIPNSSLFIDTPIYLWKIYDLHVLSCWYSNRREESKETFKKLWKAKESGLIPQSENDRLTENRKFFS